MLLQVLNERVTERCAKFGWKPSDDVPADVWDAIAFEEWRKLLGEKLPDDPEAAYALGQQFEHWLAEQERAAGLPGVGEKRTPPPAPRPTATVPVARTRRPTWVRRVRSVRRSRATAPRRRRQSRAGPSSRADDDEHHLTAAQPPGRWAA